jgi:acyl-CoA reductase-like NAD-dependent aldehyde dehydrogenase
LRSGASTVRSALRSATWQGRTIWEPNRSIYGLGGSVWSRDVERAVGAAGTIEAGQVWINSHGVHAINHLASYGGVKLSGIGRRSGIEGIREYTQSQTITTHEPDLRIEVGA